MSFTATSPFTSSAGRSSTSSANTKDVVPCARPCNVEQHERVRKVLIDSDLHDAAPVLVLLLVMLGDQRSAREMEENAILEDRRQLLLATNAVIAVIRE
ncbi:hypothetical protein F3J20_11875 [Paraburkholderia sp. Cy-641]|uniref:hypothetical protein n=1 Tax=Paraburkholderia sp. Cy-641 TaxID=2608337 RepID=UPI001422B74B|nr:hypothetical protein [Paraburkholderia sp. Cy-641]NIF78087.1 hypothetical protein [Paraburkholderia sp. Cy-641]